MVSARCCISSTTYQVCWSMCMTAGTACSCPSLQEFVYLAACASLQTGMVVKYKWAMPSCMQLGNSTAVQCIARAPCASRLGLLFDKHKLFPENIDRSKHTRTSLVWPHGMASYRNGGPNSLVQCIKNIFYMISFIPTLIVREGFRSTAKYSTEQRIRKYCFLSLQHLSRRHHNYDL